MATSLLRAPLVLSRVLPTLLVAHMIGGGAIAIIAIIHVALARTSHRWWRLTLVAGTGVFGWFAHRSVAPFPTASHAALAAVATIALTEVHDEAPASNNLSSHRWIAIVARIGFSLVMVQVAVGAALRHHLIALTWHLVIGGLAAMAVLAVGVATIQDQSSTVAEKQTARSAVAAIVTQASLGVVVLFMMLIGPPNAGTWIVITVGHVVVGSLTLLAVARLNRLVHHHHANRLIERAPHG